jgi:hypothetical protein
MTRFVDQQEQPEPFQRGWVDGLYRSTADGIHLDEILRRGAKGAHDALYLQGFHAARNERRRHLDRELDAEYRKLDEATSAWRVELMICMDGLGLA